VSRPVVAGGAAHAAAPSWWRSPRLRRWLGPLIALGFLVAVGWLLADQIQAIDWRQFRSAIGAYGVGTLAGAAALVVASHLTYASYELLGRRYVGHHLPAARVLGVGFVSYAFNLNLGSLIGGFGFRLRLYSQLGLDAAQIARIIALSLVTNWSGWLLLTGLVFAAGRVPWPASFPIAPLRMQAIGAAMVLLPLAYVLACWRSTRREWRWRDHCFVLPSGRMALAQLALSSLNWALIGAVVWLLLPHTLGYGTVLATHLSAAVIAVPTHVPGGLGVLEAVYVAVLGDEATRNPLIAGLLAFRALYYLAPLVVAAALHLLIEAAERRRRRGG
jgi:glycosyltransferase 2 family protein